MKRKQLYVLIAVVLCLIGGLAALHFSTNVKPYKVYPSEFQQRGDELTEDRFPENVSDSLFAMKMEQLQFKDEIRNEVTQNKISWNGVIGSICLLLTALTGIVALFVQWLNGKRSEDITELKTLVIGHHAENIKQHEKIFNVLEVVEDITIRKNISESIRSIARNYMHYQKGAIPDDLQTLITAQAERLIELSEQIMTERFTIDVFDVATIKIDEQCAIAIRQVTELFGCDFVPYYKNAQKLSVIAFRKRLHDIVTDTEFNGKYDRYKRASEYFLDELIRLTINEYHKYIKDESNHSKSNS